MPRLSGRALLSGHESKGSGLHIRAGSEPDPNTSPNVKLLKHLVLPWRSSIGLPPAATSSEIFAIGRIGHMFLGFQNSRPNASGKQRKFVKIDGFCFESVSDHLKT